MKKNGIYKSIILAIFCMFIAFAASTALADANDDFNALKELPPTINISCDKELVRIDQKAQISCDIELPYGCSYKTESFNITYTFYRSSNSNMNDAEVLYSGEKSSYSVLSETSGVSYYRCDVLFTLNDMNVQQNSQVLRLEFYEARANVSYNASALTLGSNESAVIKASAKFRYYDDKGRVNYQWYKSYSRNGQLIKIDGANAKELALYGDREEGTVYYLCDAANIVVSTPLGGTYTYSSVVDGCTRICVSYTGIEVSTLSPEQSGEAETETEPEYSLPDVTLPFETSTLEAITEESESDAETVPTTKEPVEVESQSGLSIWIYIGTGAALIFAVCAAIFVTWKVKRK